MRTTWLRVLGFALSLAVSAPSLASVILSAASQIVSQGQLTTIEVNISGLGNGTALGGFDLNIGFDPSLLGFSSAAYGDPTLGDQLDLEGFGTYTDTVTGTGTTEITELSFDSAFALTSLQAANFTLASLTFDALAPGVSPVTLSVNALPDQNGNSIAAGTVSGLIDIQSAGGAAVPEPGTWLLFCGGLVMLVLRGYRRASNGASW
jgi:hypothetical protein